MGPWLAFALCRLVEAPNPRFKRGRVRHNQSVPLLFPIVAGGTSSNDNASPRLGSGEGGDGTQLFRLECSLYTSDARLTTPSLAFALRLS